MEAQLARHLKDREASWRGLEPGYYVTVKDAGRTGFLLGPFSCHRDALANVKLGRDLANAHNERAWFYAYGTAQVKALIPGASRPVFDGHACGLCPVEG